ncbi:hypothetical protein [Microcoleus sp. D2_18a_D3]|uniref:hypothetical protein n=1 Tax=Microcoleus sp. D2_18a_D3 TaxID=3055330 RepID=UPI002FD1DC5D
MVGGGGGSAADFVTDLTDGWLVGGRFGSGFCNGFNGWVAGWWENIRKGFDLIINQPLIIRYIRYKIRC